MHRFPLLATAAALLLAAPAAAHADAPWSAPQNVSTPHLFVDSLSVGFGADGTGLSTWLASNPSGGSGGTTTGEVDGAALAPGATSFGAEHTISKGPNPSVVSAPVHYATSRTLVLTQRPESTTLVKLSAVFGDANGVFGNPHTIVVGKNVRSAVLAADAAGDAVIAWYEDLGVTSDRVYVSFRLHGSSFGAPVLLDTGRIRSVSAAVSPRGDVLVAWDARGIIQTRVKAHTSMRFGALDTIESDPTYYASIRTAMTANGRAYVAWGAQLLTEGGSRGDVYYEAAVRPAGAPQFRAAQLLEHQSANQVKGNLDLVTDNSNAALVAWTGFDGANYRVRTSMTNASASFAGFQNVSPAGVDSLEGALAGTPDGRRLVAWVSAPDDAGGGVLDAAVAPAGGLFGAPELVSSGPESRVPAAAFDARDNRWALAWSNRPNGSSGPEAGIQTFLQASLRPAG